MDSDSSRLDKSLHLQDSILNAQQPPSVRNRCTKNAEDAMFLHILDCIGALSCIRNEQKKSFCRKNSSSSCNSNKEQASALLSCKHRVFWQAVREIADREAVLEDIPATEEKEKSSALDYMLECFPDETKQSDGRLWLPLHFAVSLPNIRLEDIETLFTANPAAIKAGADEIIELNPFHLAAMTKNPQMEIIQRLQLYYPRGGSSLDNCADTPLHCAAWHSDSAAMIRELAQLHPAALEMKNAVGETPLHAALMWSTSVEVVRELIALSPAALVTTNDDGKTPLMTTIITGSNSLMFQWKLQLLLEAAPQAARIPCFDDKLPLHYILSRSNPPATPEQVAMNLAAHKEAVNVPDNTGSLPIFFAAEYASLDVMKIIAEENMSHLSARGSRGASVAHRAVVGLRLENLQYIHSVMPELLLSLTATNRTPLHFFLFKDKKVYLKKPLSAASDVLRFLLRHCPSLASARDSYGHTVYDHLLAGDVGFAYARRLLLMAGASSLYPRRRQALLLFHSGVTRPSIYSRIRYSAAGPELMRTIVSFL
jgi:ankyrin repeat protein